MGRIVVYNTKTDDYTNHPNNFPIYRGTPLGNPYTHDGKESKLAIQSFKTRKEALNAYENYFREMYGKNEMFTDAFDRIYKRYKNGEDIFLQCFCKPLPCHGDFIAKMLQQKLIQEYKEKKKKVITEEC